MYRTSRSYLTPPSTMVANRPPTMLMENFMPDRARDERTLNERNTRSDPKVLAHTVGTRGTNGMGVGMGIAKTVQNRDVMQMTITPKVVENLSLPDVWGPAFWFTLHNGANSYPTNASGLVKERMKWFLLGLPEIIPCLNCKEHARDHIESSNLEAVCDGHDSLFRFFVDFHNYVNKRYNKPVMTYDDAIKLYSNGAIVNVVSYK